MLFVTAYTQYFFAYICRHAYDLPQYIIYITYLDQMIHWLSTSNRKHGGHEVLHSEKDYFNKCFKTKKILGHYIKQH
jgi:hypothetical protein